MQLSLFDLIKDLTGIDRFVSEKKKRRTRRPTRPRTRRTQKSDPSLKRLWLQIRSEYFPERDDLDDYVVKWSSRKQLRTLASCGIERRVISVARELNYPEHLGWLPPLIYHEMCHAYLGNDVEKSGGRHAWHGPEFKALEARHPYIKSLDKWIKEGGWARAVRSDRSKRAHQARKEAEAA